MSIGSEKDWLGLTRIGRIVGETLRLMQRHVAQGVTTRELDLLAAAALVKAGAQPTPRRVYQFPGATCISVNDEVVHGIPGDRILRRGDVVKVDVTADCNGYVADAARTVVVGDAEDSAMRLSECARSAFKKSLLNARAGKRVRDIGKLVEREVHRQGFRVIRELCGHGVGRTIHEEPEIPNYDDPHFSRRLTDGLVITIEPIIAVTADEIFKDDDGWTLRTIDGSIAAHHEETIVITRGKPLILTAA